jgi:hypothetical protein
MLSQEEFEELISDPSKRIDEDIQWTRDSNNLWVKFRAKVITDSGHDLFIQGSFNVFTNKLSYHIIYRPVGRIYGLDMGQEHPNPDRQLVGEIHKHRWTEAFKDREAYAPDDITAPATNPVEVWQQFCQEAGIAHNGTMSSPPDQQLDLFL